MKFPLVLLTLLQLHQITQPGNENLIDTTCRTTANYDLCVSAVTADPRSAAAAKVEEVGLIVVEAVRVKAEVALSVIKGMKPTSPEYRAAMEDCRDSYEAVVMADVPEAVAALTRGVPKFAEYGMKDAAWEAEICDRRLGTAAEKGTLRDVNKSVQELAGVACGIIRNLL